MDKIEEEGRSAYRRGVTKCPYAIGSQGNPNRVRWWDGWLTERTGNKLGHIFERNGMIWPPVQEEIIDEEEKEIR